MWKINKLAIFEIIDDKLNRIIATGLDENQAQTLCDTHNTQISDIKWEKEKIIGGGVR